MWESCIPVSYTHLSAEAASGNYGDKTIGFVGMTLNNEYHITLANGAKVEAEPH